MDNGKFNFTKEQFFEMVAHSKEMIKSGERCGEIVNVPTFAIPEKGEFCLFIDVARSTFDSWLSVECLQNNEQLHYIATRVNDYIQSYQTKSGIVGLANPMLVARINNITETLNVQSNLTLNSLPLHINNNIIDLTESDYTILNTTVNKSELKLSE